MYSGWVPAKFFFLPEAHTDSRHVFCQNGAFWGALLMFSPEATSRLALYRSVRRTQERRLLLVAGSILWWQGQAIAIMVEGSASCR